MVKRTITAIAISMTVASAASAEEVEITLVDNLDGNLSGYCIDILGSKSNATPERGIQAHTCYSYQGALGIDQVFDTDRFAENVLYMPEFDVCVTANRLEAGETLDLAACDGSAAQQISLNDNGTLTPVAASDMCFTVGEETRLGRGGTSAHQIKSLTLQSCSDDLTAYQTWGFRASADG